MTKSKKASGTLLLLLTALIWGSAFVVQEVGMEYVGPLTFNSVRMLLGGVVLLPVSFIKDAVDKKRGVFRAMSKTDKLTLLKAGAICGLVLLIASSLQQIGLGEGTNSGKAGFISAFYILIVPIFGLFLKRPVRPLIWLCVFAALAGLYLLCVKEDFTIVKGDIYVFLSAVGFAVHILVIDKYSPLTDGVKLSCAQFLTAGTIGVIGMLIFEQPILANILSAWPLILYAGALSCGIAYTLQIIAQKHVPPTLASLVMSMESVFAMLAGAVVLGQIPAAKELIGAALMLAAMITARLLPERKKKNA